MNTIFKFYLQVWVLWGMATAACMPLIAARLSKMPGRVLRRLWWPAFAVLLAAGWLYPLLATRSRIDSRIEAQVGKTLDGTAYMAQAVYWDQGQEIILA